ncbi:MAG: helix-turn-helix domain-containing protein [Tyzzerella nexilis]|nr:helix-turn-helix domain-containing protein [[Clostridium] nexile]
MAKGKYQEWLEPEGLLKIEGWARDGLTDEQIADNIGISRSTLNSWKDKYSDISDTLKRGKEVVDRQVENALLKRALGYEYTETTREYIPELDEMKTTKKVTKQVAPDTTAQIFWLKNRKPDKWRDKLNRDCGSEDEMEGVEIINDADQKTS